MSGFLKVYVYESNSLIPVPDAAVEIYSEGEPDYSLGKYQTNIIGETEVIFLPAPPINLSEEPGDDQPYSVYNIRVTKSDHTEVLYSGVQIFEDRIAMQRIYLNKVDAEYNSYPIVIGPHTLFEYYPPKIAETSVKPIRESGEIVLSRVVVPETIVVHDGVPTDKSAKDYYVNYTDYIKNVASCEIYATWPTAALEANILAIISFTLNRVYTEWYRNKNYNFTITSSTAYDQKWIYGKTIYESIDQVVDRLFNTYITKPNIKQPLLTQYCDGKTVSCPNWMSQWGSKALADKGLSSLEILKNYYGNDIYLTTSESISGIPSSYPGTLSNGSSGDKVRFLQEELSSINKAYPLIPAPVADGIYGPKTAESVRVFQKVFNLPQTGITDYATWYKISQIYVGVNKLGPK